MRLCSRFQCAIHATKDLAAPAMAGGLSYCRELLESLWYGDYIGARFSSGRLRQWFRDRRGGGTRETPRHA